MQIRRCLMTALLGGALTITAQALSQSDLAREQRMADDIVDAILDGESLHLATARGHRFLGIFTHAVDDVVVKGTAVILHGRGLHPDWADVVQPLRIGLPEHGWNTLSIQLPVLTKGAKYYDYVNVFSDAIPRIEAAVMHARKHAGRNLVLIAHSCGTHMAQHWFNVRGDAAVTRINAYVGIGMGATDYGQVMVEPFGLEGIRVPVLDVYGAQDFPAVRRFASERLLALEAGGHPQNTQIMVPEADHYFVDRGDALLEAVAGWLEAL